MVAKFETRIRCKAKMRRQLAREADGKARCNLDQVEYSVELVISWCRLRPTLDRPKGKSTTKIAVTLNELCKTRADTSSTHAHKNPVDPLPSAPACT